jgi:crossover junction endodeoxyribonuclease RusA
MPIVELIVPGTPISLGASPRSKNMWRAKVAAAAQSALPISHVLVADPVRATVMYFYVRTDLDLDNILKPILDSMNGIVYVDDSQIVNIMAAKRDIAGSYVLADVSPILVQHLASGINNDFVFIAIEVADTGAVI